MTRAHQRHDRLQKARREIAANHFAMKLEYAAALTNYLLIAVRHGGYARLSENIGGIPVQSSPTTKTNNAL